MGQAAADLESQGKASEYALRKRLHELERALTELEWQKKQVFSILTFFFISLFSQSRRKKKSSVMKMILIVWKKLFEVNKKERHCLK